MYNWHSPESVPCVVEVIRSPKTWLGEFKILLL
jgi:hypothetical protein